MKKYKLFVFAIAIAIMSVITVNAREMTISELGQAAIDQYKDSGQDVGYIYVIGEYAFTSQYDIKTEDIMLAAKSINLDGQDPVKFVEDSTELSDAYKKMVINTIRAKVDDDFNISGWEISDAAVGTANLVAENKFNIRYIDYVFQAETSKADIKFDKATEDNYQSYLNKDFGISDVSVLYDELTYTDGKLSGLILRHEIQKGFPDKDKTGYYLPFVIEVPDLREDTIVTIEEDSKVTATYNNFDIQNKADGKNPGIIVLWSIPGENGKKSITIVVDIDGDKDEYGPTTYTIDYTDLRFQGESKIEDIKLNNAHESDKATLTSWGYNFDKNKDKDGKAPTLTKNGNDFSYKLTGTLVEQKLNEKAYGSDKADAYYFDFTFVLENNSDKKAVIKALNGDYGNAKTHTQDEYDENGNLTILQRISKNTKCDNDNKANCIAKFEIDLDGDGKEYYPVIYTIDYSEVILEKASLVEMSEVSLESFEEEHWNGFEEDESYSTTFTTEGDVVKVTGLITIFDDSKWKDSTNPFESGAYDYYLAFKLKKSEATGTQVNETVKFLTDGAGDGEQNEITDTDFGENDEIYVLKYINPFKPDTTKQFTIKVDLDGAGDNYAPYVLTVDWSKLEFQQESRNTEVKPLSEVETTDKNSPQYIEEKDKTEIQKWGYEFDKNSDLNIKSTGTNTSELTGTVKEQTVNGAGFKTSKGYFMLVKIYGPKAELLEGTVLDTDEGTKKWTIKLQDEDGKWQDPITPNEKDYENGFITVLFRLDEQEKKILYQIDYDGDEDYFLPHEETITYDTLTLTPAQEVKVNGKKEENVSIYLGEPIPTEILTKLEEEQVNSIDEELQPYRDFTYFTTSDGTTQVDETTPVTKDMLSDGSLDLTPHWNLYSDKFVADVLKDLNNTEDSKSENFNTEFVVEDYVENSGEITINVINPDVKVARMNDTSIPGAIAHILLEDEIKEITLVADSGNSKTFTKGDASDKETLKGTIKDEVKSLYSSILSSSFGGDENSITLSQLAQNETYKTFTLKINTENIADNVTLAKAPAENGISLASDITVPTEYKITFKSDIVSVNTLQLLKTALNGSAKTIFISDGFEVNEKLDVTRPVTINGDNKVLTANNTTDSIFNVTTSGVTIENLELKAGNASKTLISVTESGKLTTKQLKITSDDTNGLDAAIDVTSGGNVTITEMQYDKEHYNHPAVRAAKDNATVNLTDTEGNQANAIEKEKITSSETGNDEKVKDGEYKYNNYYNDSKNSLIYKTELYNYQAGARLSYIKYNYYNENVKIPKDIDPYKFSNFTYNGETYDLIAFSKNSFNILRGDENLLETDIAKDQLKATENDAHYWAVYKVTLQEGVKKVSSEDEFKQAVKDQETHAIYVSGTTDAPLEIDYTNENDGTFKIEKDLSIIGSSNLKVTIKAKKIETSADANNVLINRINLEVNAQENQQSLIDVNGNKLSLWQSSLKNIGTAVDYAIKYNSQTAVVDIRFMGRGSNGFKDSNINKSYIYVTGKLDEGSDLYSNEFPKIDGKTTTAIIIDGFTENAKVTEDEDGEPDIRFENNTVGTPYAIVFTKNTSGQQADIKLGNSTIKIGIEYADGKKNFEGIGLFANHDNVTITYINGDAEYQEQEQQPEDVQGPKFKSVITMVES